MVAKTSDKLIIISYMTSRDYPGYESIQSAQAVRLLVIRRSNMQLGKEYFTGSCVSECTVTNLENWMQWGSPVGCNRASNIGSKNINMEHLNIVLSRIVRIVSYQVHRKSLTNESKCWLQFNSVGVKCCRRFTATSVHTVGQW